MKTKKRDVMIVRANPGGLQQTVLQADAKDANLTFCLAYLIARSFGDNVISIDDMAAKVRVSNYTLKRWVRTLAGMGLVSFKNAPGQAWDIEVGKYGKPVANRTLPRQRSPRKERVENATAKGSDGKNDTVGSPPTPPSVTDSTSKPVSKTVLSISEQSRLDSAISAYSATVIINERAGGEFATKTLVSVVKNKLFDGIDLAHEIRQADAWLTQSKKKYTDMDRYFVNWLRNCARRKKQATPSNANPAPAKGKYDEIEQRGKVWA